MNDNLSLINDKIDAALEVENREQPARDYLGASMIGEACERRLGYDWHKHAGTPFPGKVIRRFRMGHLHEDETARWLKLAGFVVHGEQSEFALADGKFAGHVDGFLMSGPVDLPYPVLWEHKIMKSSVWRKLKGGETVRHAHPRYYAQMQVYMRQFDLRAGLFTALNTDTSELHFELIEYDDKAAESYIEKAVRILSSRDPLELPRIGATRYDFLCSFCPHKDTCWDIPKANTSTPPPWLKK